MSKQSLLCPQQQKATLTYTSIATPDPEGWIKACLATALHRSDVLLFDLDRKTFALYRDDSDLLYATDGMCTHGNVHLSAGLVKGTLIECSKHNGRFSLLDGSPARVPICRGLATYPFRIATANST